LPFSIVVVPELAARAERLLHYRRLPKHRVDLHQERADFLSPSWHASGLMTHALRGITKDDYPVAMEWLGAWPSCPKTKFEFLAMPFC
jgi:hypothetical protein